MSKNIASFVEANYDQIQKGAAIKNDPRKEVTIKSLTKQMPRLDQLFFFHVDYNSMPIDIQKKIKGNYHD